MALLTEERQKPSVHLRDCGDDAIFGGDLGKVRHSHTAAVALGTAEPNVAAGPFKHPDRTPFAGVPFFRLGFRVRPTHAAGRAAGGASANAAAARQGR